MVGLPGELEPLRKREATTANAVDPPSPHTHTSSEAAASPCCRPHQQVVLAYSYSRDYP